MYKNITHEQLINELKYKQAYKVISIMLEKEIITEKEFNFINDKFKATYSPLLSELYNL